MTGTPDGAEVVGSAGMVRLTAEWREQQAEAQRLDMEIEANLERLGFGVEV